LDYKIETNVLGKNACVSKGKAEISIRTRIQTGASTLHSRLWPTGRGGGTAAAVHSATKKIKYLMGTILSYAKNAMQFLRINLGKND
jgi:hypothetical protein